MIATGFLGYKRSPKWFNISKKTNLQKNKKKIINNKRLFSNNLINSNRFLLFNKNIIISSRSYCTQSSLISETLKTSIKELSLNPVYFYENLNLENTLKQISKDTKGLSGIYMIYNKITKDYYIGSASTNRFYSRFSNHLIYFRGSKIVKLAIKKYKLENFAFIILELYPNLVTKENNKELIDLEDRYLKLLLPNYNILTEAGSSFGYKHTEIDRQKMKDIYSDARREKIGNLNRGKKLSEETIEKIRIKGLNRPPMTEETRKKCAVNTSSILLYNLDRTLYGKYNSILEAANAISCSEKTIRRSLQTDKKLVKRQWIVES
jgi:group I intron endonuclease